MVFDYLVRKPVVAIMVIVQQRKFKRNNRFKKNIYICQ
jgi:hypothetical protein